MSQSPNSELSSLESKIVALLDATNQTELGKRLQMSWLHMIVRPTVHYFIHRRAYVVGDEWITNYQPERGTLMASNHRSFFDQWALMLSLWPARLRFFERICFPTRANFFYETPVGVFINYLFGGGSLYPPIFRQAERAELNKIAVDQVNEMLADPRVLVGVHPEGTRGKGPDPYEMLRPQPGIGQMILHGRPVVIPAFVNGVTNDFLGTLKTNYLPGVARQNPIVVVFGKPFDYSEFEGHKPRAAIYLKCARKLMADIKALSEIEKDVRARIVSGEISDSDPGWVRNRRFR
ncbi:MAG: 1-acyl-sn-glycerol-3-phosphate acyltransferase [Deltaproteobacteria bacterium]|nr:1-acyl-sn-glycerol-3-phosphate acyltransferase [Deltaproteobacteria bacterium]